MRKAHALGRPGNDLLSRALRRSTIGAKGLHGRVRDGIGCGPLAIATRSSKRMCASGAHIRRINPDIRPTCVMCIGAHDPKNRDRRARTPTNLAAVRGSMMTICSDPEGSARKRSAIKPIEQLVLVSFTCCHASTPSLSTWWSSTALERNLVLRGASRLDAFSGYPFRT